MSLVGLLDSLGVMGVDARSSFNGGVQGPLSDRQWEREVEVWWQAALAMLQLGITEQATGPSLASAEVLFTKPHTKAGYTRCKNQMIRSTAYASFSTLGIVIIFSLGGCFIILSYILEPCVNFIQRKHGLDVYHRLEWATNGTLQLQRLAHEELGLGTWTGAAADVPIVVASGDRQTSCKLAMVNVSDVEHPKLVASPEPLERQMVGETGKTV
ncbi:Cytochrome p450 protein [Lasiodiplodia theobromae]|uniref:Cytochrome p450 protein n=1 Tax=Lasiodiplodia theobromae TaxID=45133 RepID=UPI0015C39FD7|nr:Cytochrome p450 protein [Lasiodiplodia theobromae]KAF4541466.1 Cytochrome p450 protein [Lasiodiplodia theobromae]